MVGEPIGEGRHGVGCQGGRSQGGRRQRGRRRGAGTGRRVGTALAALLLLGAAGCGGAEPAEEPTPSATAAPQAAAPVEDAASPGPDVDRRSSSGSVHVETGDAIATPGSDGDAPTPPASRDAVVEEAAAALCGGPGLDFAVEQGADADLVAGYATVLGAMASWQVVDGTSTQSVSVVDTSRPDAAPVAVCYYDGAFASPVPGRDVSRIGVLVHDDGEARLILRGGADTLGLHAPPDGA